MGPNFGKKSGGHRVRHYSCLLIFERFALCPKGRRIEYHLDRDAHLLIVDSVFKGRRYVDLVPPIFRIDHDGPLVAFDDGQFDRSSLRTQYIGKGRLSTLSLLFACHCAGLLIRRHYAGWGTTGQ